MTITLRCPRCNVPITCEAILTESGETTATYAVDLSAMTEHTRAVHDPRIELVAEALRADRSINHVSGSADAVARIAVRALNAAGALVPPEDPS